MKVFNMESKDKIHLTYDLTAVDSVDKNVNKDIQSDKQNYNQDEIWIESDCQGSPLVNFVMPILGFLRLIFMTHSRFEYQDKERTFQHIPGSIFRKLICAIIPLLGLSLSWGETKLIQKRTEDDAFGGLLMLLGISYIGLMGSFHYGLMCKGEKIKDILNFTQSMSCCIAKAGCQIPRRKIIKPVSTFLLIVYITEAILFTIVNVDGTSAMLLQMGFKNFLKNCADHGARKYLTLFSSLPTSSVQDYKFSVEWRESPSTIFVVGFLHFLLHLWFTLNWVMAFLMLTLWGLLFWKVFHIFFALISNSTTRNTMEDIRAFNKITRSIDQFNKAFGWTVLFVVVAGVLHFSVNIVDLFNGKQVWTHKSMVCLNLATFGAVLLTAAKVNDCAANITEVMKGRYQERSAWHQMHGQCSETTQGMLLIVSEVQSNKIGFCGLGFFTITFSFIGTVLSLIATYSLVVMQFRS